MAKKGKTKKAKKQPVLSISFAGNSRKKDAIVFREGGKFIDRKQYLKKSGLKESQLKFAIENVINPATNDRGQLLKKDKKNVQALFNSFISNKNNIPDEYNLTVNLTSIRSLNSLRDKDIFVSYKAKEYKFTFNDFVYFSAQLLERFESAFYMSVEVKINESLNSAYVEL